MSYRDYRVRVDCVRCKEQIANFTLQDALDEAVKDTWDLSHAVQMKIDGAILSHNDRFHGGPLR